MKISYDTKDVFVKMRDGRKGYIAIVLPTWMDVENCVVGGVRDPEGKWGESSWDIAGKYNNKQTAHDIVDLWDHDENEETLSLLEIKKIKRILNAWKMETAREHE